MLLLKGEGDGATVDEPNGVVDDPKVDEVPIGFPPPKIPVFGVAVGPTFDEANGDCELECVPPPKGMLLALLAGCPNGDAAGAGELNKDGADDEPKGVVAGAGLPNGVELFWNGEGLAELTDPKFELNGDCC